MLLPSRSRSTPHSGRGSTMVRTCLRRCDRRVSALPGRVVAHAGLWHRRLEPSMDAPTARAPAPVPLDGGQHVQLGDEYYVLASSLASRRRRHVLAHGDTFAVLDQSGDIPFTV